MRGSISFILSVILVFAAVPFVSAQEGEGSTPESPDSEIIDIPVEQPVQSPDEGFIEQPFESGDSQCGPDGCPGDIPAGTPQEQFTFVDTDGDRIPDEQEINMGTDPSNSDSDGDGVIDSEDLFPLDSSRSAESFENIPEECNGISMDECAKIMSERMSSFQQEGSMQVPEECAGLSPAECEMRMKDLYSERVANLPPECSGMTEQDCGNIMRERLEGMRDNPEMMPEECRGYPMEECERIMDEKYDSEFKRRAGFEEGGFDEKYEGFPVTIPEDIIAADAEQEFINLLCAMTRLNLEQMKNVINTMQSAFTEYTQDPELSFLTIDMSDINILKEDIDIRINGLCSSTPETFSEAAKALQELIEGDLGIERRMQGVFKDQIKARIEEKVQTFEVQMQAFSGGMPPTGGAVMVEQSRVKVTRQGLPAQCAGLDISGCRDLMEQTYCQGLVSEQCEAAIQTIMAGGSYIPPTIDIQNDTQQCGPDGCLEGNVINPEDDFGSENMPEGDRLGSGDGMQGPSIEEMQEMQAIQTEMMALMSKVQGLPQFMMSKTQEALAMPVSSELKRAVAEAQIALFKKVFDSYTSIAMERKQELLDNGLNVSVFDGLEEWKQEKIAEAETLVSDDFNISAFHTFEKELRTEYDEWKLRIETNVAEQIYIKFQTEYASNRERIDEAISVAKEKGLDTSKAEYFISQMDVLSNDIKNKKESGETELMFSLMRDLKFKYSMLKEEIDGFRQTLDSASFGGDEQ